MNAPDLIRKVQSSGGAIWVEGERLELEVPYGFPETLIEELRDHKFEILAALDPAESMHLPFPIGYGGLPNAQVKAAQAVMDKFEVTDPVLRKYNVISWLRGFYQDRGENHGAHYESIIAEQLRLGCILDPAGDP